MTHAMPHRVEHTRGVHIHPSILSADFAALARAYGAWASTVERTEEFGPALDDALGRKGIRLLHCVTDVEVISNARTIAEIRKS